MRNIRRLSRMLNESHYDYDDLPDGDLAEVWDSIDNDINMLKSILNLIGDTLETATAYDIEGYVTLYKKAASKIQMHAKQLGNKYGSSRSLSRAIDAFK